MTTIASQTGRPFQHVAGRNPANDAPSEIDVARYYYDQRLIVAEDASTLDALSRAINAPGDLTRAQWGQWYSVALGFRPDLIVELGRSKGNSTALFAQALFRMRHGRIVSVCTSTDWDQLTLPKLQGLVPPGWFDVLDARRADILEADYEAIIGDAGRVLVLWDAHGFEIADVVLGRILPLIAGRAHLVLIHDISDTRYVTVSRSYEGLPLWKGAKPRAGEAHGARVNIGWMNSLQEQVVAIADFATRNDVEIGSADHEYTQFFKTWPGRADEMMRVLGPSGFSTEAHWSFLTLAGREGPFHFPAVPHRFRHRTPAVVRDIHPRRWLPRRSRFPRTIATSAVPWEYAAVLGWKAPEVPADAVHAIRVQLQVQGGPIGVGLLNGDRSAFIASQRVFASIDSEVVLLPVPREGGVGPLVVHAWDESEPGRVVVEDIAVVW